MAIHSSTIAWKIPWTEEPDRLQSTGLQELDMTQRLNHHHHENLPRPYNKYWDFPDGSDGKAFCLQCGRPGFNPWVGKTSWRRKWQPTPVFLPGKSHGQSSLVGYSPWGRKQSDVIQQLNNNTVMIRTLTLYLYRCSIINLDYKVQEVTSVWFISVRPGPNIVPDTLWVFSAYLFSE